MTKNQDKKRLERKILDPERVDEQIRLRLSRLMIKEMEFDSKMRSRAVRLSRKREKQVDSWVI